MGGSDVSHVTLYCEVRTNQTHSQKEEAYEEELEIVNAHYDPSMTALDLTGVDDMPALEEIKYLDMKIKSTMPLDSRPDVLLTEEFLQW